MSTEPWMTAEGVTRELAKLGHVCWCRSMTAQGWSYSPTFDEERRRHDALVPFDRLGHHDQRRALLSMQTECIEARLAKIIQYPRGLDREFVPEEMRSGLRVGWAPKVKFNDPLRDPSSEIGLVESWKINPNTGELEVIHVRWPDGELLDHYPPDRELRRLE